MKETDLLDLICNACSFMSMLSLFVLGRVAIILFTLYILCVQQTLKCDFLYQNNVPGNASNS